jgi:DNA-binding transcriptional MerR regulator
LSGDAPGKGPLAFRTIAEVSELLDVAPHVLRFWEGKFPQLRPMKRAGGRRLYRREDIALLRGIQALLGEDGYSIKGVQKLLRDQGVAHVRVRGGEAGEQGASALVPDPSMERAAPPEPVRPASPAGPLFDAGFEAGSGSGSGSGASREAVRPSGSAGVSLRRALARLEQARAALDRVARRA